MNSEIPTKRAAITGIAGQDGTYLARWLLRQGYAVHGLLQFPFDREEPALRQRFSPEQMQAVRWHQGSLEDPFSLVRFLKASAPDEVYHLAGLTDSRQSFDVPEESLLSITLGTLRLLEAARMCCPKARLFLASSCEVFGVPAQVPQTEHTAMHPVTPYGIAKLAADQLGRLHRNRYGQFVAIGILYNHESPLRPANYLSTRVARGVAAVRRGESAQLALADLDAERDWSDARDFVRGFWLTLQTGTPDDFVFASGRRRRVEEMVDAAFRAAGLDYRRHVTRTRPEAKGAQVAAGLCGDARKAEAVLGWTREWDFARTVADMVAAELEQRPEFDRADPAPKREGDA
ncbi:MAG: GDP-mannose 4,6-dehydratase [Verrucomicrobia bacterium]|nr:GDP-mannose 4,6-dehydratase [Verrucomicrobiota bacterium]